MAPVSARRAVAQSQNLNELYIAARNADVGAFHMHVTHPKVHTCSSNINVTDASHKATRPFSDGAINKQCSTETLLAVWQEVAPTWTSRVAVECRNMSCDTGPPFPHKLAAVPGQAVGNRGNTRTAIIVPCTKSLPRRWTRWSTIALSVIDGLIAVISSLPVTQPRG